MKNYIIISILCLSLSFAQAAGKPFSRKKSTIESIIKNLEDSKSDQITVVAHRGDWRNAPENSIQSIKNCIKMGVDMVEIDIHETKDGHLVLMHDGSVDRTTNGKGSVKSWTLDSLKTLNLLDKDGNETNHKIPTLEEALLVSKDKILLNLDKSYNIFDKCYELMEKTKTLDQVIIKGAKNRAVVEKEIGKYLDKVYFMPIVSISSKSAKATIDDYLENRLPVAFEIIIPHDSLELINYFDHIRLKGSSVWVNSLWASLCAGHNDEKAAKDPTVYDWYIKHKVNIIQTDNPQLLIEYLREKGLHR